MDAARIVASAVKWGLIVGGTGFILGFVGPIIVAPGANQGPLLGIFVTGPLGFLGGLLFGAILGALPKREQGGAMGTGIVGDREALERDEDRWAA
jgi:hypothetical protein